MNLRRLVGAMAICAILAPTVGLAGITLPGGFNSGSNNNSGSDNNSGSTGLDDATVAACKADPGSCGITLSDVVGNVLFGETEPNNYMYSADTVTQDIPLTGQMHSAYDEDWYIVQATELNQILTVSLEKSPGTWEVSVRDSWGNVLAHSPTVADESFSFDVTLANQGNHYVVIAPLVTGDTYSANVYKLSTHIKSTGVADQQPPFNFFDVELEHNNLFSEANPIVTGIEMQGHFFDGGDLDVYRLDSPGNEIINLDLCPKDNRCEEQGAWVLVVVEAALVDDSFLTTLATIYVDDDDVGGGNPGQVAFSHNHPYFLYEVGRFDNARRALIDPSFGETSEVNMGISAPGTYYVMVMPVLERYEGKVYFQNQKSDAPDEVGIFVEPFSDDQYTLLVTRTGLAPSMNDLVTQP